MANYLHKRWIASIVKEDISNAFRVGADGPIRKGHPLQVIEVREEDKINAKRYGVLYVTVSDKHHSIRAKLTPQEDGEPTRGAIITIKGGCSLIYDKNPQSTDPFVLDIGPFKTTASNSDPTFGNPTPILKDAAIVEMLKELRSFPELTRSQPSSPAAPPRSSSPSQMGTQVLATQAGLPAMKAGVKVQHATTQSLLGILGRKPDARQDPIPPKKETETIPSAQIPTVLSKVSDVKISQLSSRIGAKANSRPAVNFDKAEVIATSDKPPLVVNSNSDECEKENSQESLGKSKVSTSSITANNSHRETQSEEQRKSADVVDRSNPNPFDEMTKIPRKYLRISEEQSAILESGEAWFEPSNASAPLAAIPGSVRHGFLAHLSSRDHPQQRMTTNDSENSSSESDDESEPEIEGAKVKEKSDARLPSAGLTKEGITPGKTNKSPENEDERNGHEGVSNSLEQTPSVSGEDSDWALSPTQHLKETATSLARKQKETNLESTSREATPVPENFKSLSPTKTTVSDQGTPHEMTPVPQPDLSQKDAVSSQGISPEGTPTDELPNPPPRVLQSTRRFQCHFPPSSGTELELELDELHAEGEDIESEESNGAEAEFEDIKETDKSVTQAPHTPQEIPQPSTALRGSKEVQVKNSPFVKTSKSPQKTKLSSSSDRRIPATFKPDSSKPEEFEDAMSSAPKSSSQKYNSPALSVTQNGPGHNLNNVDTDSEEYASAEENTYPSSPSHGQAIASSPPVHSPSTPNRNQPADSISPRGSMNGSPPHELIQGSPYAQVACTPSGAPKSSQHPTALSNFQDLSIPSLPPSIPHGGLAALDGASDHSSIDRTPTKRRLETLAASIRQEDSTRRDTKQMARAGRHRFRTRLLAETPDSTPQTRPQSPNKLKPESKTAPINECSSNGIAEISRQTPSPAYHQVPPKDEPVAAAMPEAAIEPNSNPRPSKLLESSEEDEGSDIIEEEDKMVDLACLPSPQPIASSLREFEKLPTSTLRERVIRQEKENLNAQQRYSPSPPKRFPESPNGSSFSETSETQQTLDSLTMQTNLLVTPDYHQRFQAAYPEYLGSRRDFTWALVYVEWLRRKNFLLPKSLIDEFIAMMSSEYLPYVRDCKSSGENIMKGWDYFDENFPPPSMRFKQGIVIPSNLESALESLDGSLVTAFRRLFDDDVDPSQTQPPGATPSTANKSALPAPTSVRTIAEVYYSTPSVTATKSKVPRSLPRKGVTQSVTTTPNHKPLAKVRQDTRSARVVEIEELRTVDSPDSRSRELGSGADIHLKRKFESSGSVHDGGMREMLSAKRSSSPGTTGKPADTFVTPSSKKPRLEPRNSFPPRPFEAPSLPVSANSSRSAKSQAAVEDRKGTPILLRDSFSPHPSTVKTPAGLALAGPRPRAVTNITTPNVQKLQSNLRNSSSPHPSTSNTPSLSALANSSRLPKSAHAVMDEKAKIEKWNLLPHDNDYDNSQSIALENEDANKLKRKSIQQSIRQKSMADDKVASTDDDDDDILASASKSINFWDQLQRNPSPDSIQRLAQRQSPGLSGQAKGSITLPSNDARPKGKLRLKPTPSPSIVLPSLKRQSVDLPPQDKVIASPTPRQGHAPRAALDYLNVRRQSGTGAGSTPTKSEQTRDIRSSAVKLNKVIPGTQVTPSSTIKPKKEVNTLKRKSPPDGDGAGGQRVAKRKQLTFEDFLLGGEYMRMRQERRSLSLAGSRNSTPVGKGIESELGEGKEVEEQGAGKGKGKRKTAREPETQGWDH